ncbi:hypothetical protein AJ87_17230 [Rhizobium yanglingense]|nr:hypothetical protein AJ87_17230 [Rhizobium yanglingense]
MLLRSMFAQKERSLRSIRMDLSGINLFVGENGAGKGTLRRAIDGWRFFHGLRADRSSPLRTPCLAVTAPMLDEDGSNLAAVLASLVHRGGYRRSRPRDCFRTWRCQADCAGELLAAAAEE